MGQQKSINLITQGRPQTGMIISLIPGRNILGRDPGS